MRKQLIFILVLLIIMVGTNGNVRTVHSTASVPTKIMPLGDSITDGYNIPGGYRIYLSQLFLTNHNNIDFVGSQLNGPSSLCDKDHEGHIGSRIDQITESIDIWLHNNQPDIILLMIGTNDMTQNYQIDTAPQRLSELIDKIITNSPHVHIFVASIPPLREPIYNQRVIRYNTSLQDIIRIKISEGKNITYVDIYSAVTLDDLADGGHPNAEGYKKIANTWYAELARYLALPNQFLPTNTDVHIFIPIISYNC